MVENERHPLRLSRPRRAAGISGSSTASSRPSTHTFAFKGIIDCNWLQSLEVGIDPVHTSFLHRFFEDEDPDQGYGRMFRDTSKDSDMPMTQIMREFPRPRIEVEPTDYGLRLATLRQIDATQGACAGDQSGLPQRLRHSAEPRDDDHAMARAGRRREHYWYAIFTCFGAPVNKDEMRRQRLELYALPDYVPRNNKRNNYGFDPHEQEHATYTGMGDDINVHDQWAASRWADPGPHRASISARRTRRSRLSPPLLDALDARGRASGR